MFFEIVSAKNAGEPNQIEKMFGNKKLSLKFRIKNVHLHLHHWLSSLVALILIVVFRPGIVSGAWMSLVCGLCIGGVFQGLRYEDRLKVIWYEVTSKEKDTLGNIRRHTSSVLVFQHYKPPTENELESPAEEEEEENKLIEDIVEAETEKRTVPRTMKRRRTERQQVEWRRSLAVIPSRHRTPSPAMKTVHSDSEVGHLLSRDAASRDLFSFEFDGPMFDEDEIDEKEQEVRSDKVASENDEKSDIEESALNDLITSFLSEQPVLDEVEDEEEFAGMSSMFSSSVSLNDQSSPVEN
jgi:hypothetical protein